MKLEVHHRRSAALWPLILLASLAGGLAEIIWVSLYAAFSPLAAADVAREVTASLLPVYAAGDIGVWLGVVIHLLLAIMLGHAFAYVVWKPYARPRGIVATLVVSVLTLAVVWAVNFLVVLPVINPVFITLMPYSVAFASKVLFALAMAVTLVVPELREMSRKRTSPLQLAE